MGICCAKCRARADKRKYLRTRYNVEREISVEFETLMDEDITEISLPQNGSVVTDEERSIVSERRFQDLIKYQKAVDAEIAAQLYEQERGLMLEEESLRASKRVEAFKRVEATKRVEASRRGETKVVGQAKESGGGSRTAVDARRAIRPAQQSTGEMTIGEEDFEEFLGSASQKAVDAKHSTSHVAQIESAEAVSDDGMDDLELEDEDFATLRQVENNLHSKDLPKSASTNHATEIRSHD